MQLQSIGTVRSPVSTGVDEDWGSVTAELHLSEWLAPGLAGLSDFSHLIVVFWMHEASFERGSDLVRRPRGRADLPELGIFAQRAKHRPNPIGITPVRLLEVAGQIVTVQGLDAIDGTPILDLKPYVPAFDLVKAPTTPAWMDELMRGYF
jgi:tRNA-Thr(GGU) m(6)t(6)A37 methyltransferase TsaA